MLKESDDICERFMEGEAVFVRGFCVAAVQSI